MVPVYSGWGQSVKQLHVGIAGAGIGGLALAAALAQKGHRVEVFDQFDAPRPVGSGLVIQPVGQAVLSKIGALQQAAAMGQRITHMLGHDSAVSRPILDVSYDPDGRAGRYGLALHRSALFAAVLTAAQKAGVGLTPARKVTGITDGTMRRLCFDAAPDSAPFDLVVDACGAGSPLSPLQSRALPYGAIWGTVDWPQSAPLPTHQLSQRYRAARRMVGVLPIGCLPRDDTPKAAVFWSLKPDELKQWKVSPIEDWKAEAGQLWPEMEPFLHQITRHDQMTPAFYTHGTLRHPIAPGLAHIGDAAHRASPQLGQGANMALLDAWALAYALNDVPDVQAALALYARARRRHLWVYQMMSAVFTPLYQSDSTILPMLRNHILAPMAQIPPVPRILARLVCGDLIAPLHAVAGRAMSEP